MSNQSNAYRFGRKVIKKNLRKKFAFVKLEVTVLHVDVVRSSVFMGLNIIGSYRE